MNKIQLTVIGGGQMGRALVGGMLQSGVQKAENIHVVEVNELGRAWWNEHHPSVNVGGDLIAGVRDAQTVLLAVKPNVLPIVTQQPDQTWVGKLVVSIAAGVGMKKLCQWIGHQRVARVMPNTPSLVGQGASAFCVGESVTEDDTSQIKSMLQSVGLVVEVKESQMDAVTGLSGSGPAYVCLMIEALADGGVLSGLPRPLAMQLATQTVLGTAKMVAETGRHPGELKDAVASPGGTTIEALRVLEQNGVRGALIQAVKASADRSRELGQD
ncbi:pyrroline-5-carboxylate reductase [Planctomycetes bacterium K23_9]|uniref:pyrroline-5-carboxylate reductase n=1 Tax=Stieleria marina TaxID=1930275 RepID=UPI00119CBC05